MNYQFIVMCHECSQEHFTNEVEFLNVEEDVHGRDVMYFLCPVTGTEEKSYVYKSNYTTENMNYWEDTK